MPATPTLTSFTVEAAAGGSIGAQVTGVAFNIKLTAKDQFGATLTSFTGTATITSSGTLSGGSGTTASFTAGVLASHSVTFSAVGGSVTITATNGGASGVSNSFAVTAGAWTTLRTFNPTTESTDWQYNSFGVGNKANTIFINNGAVDFTYKIGLTDGSSVCECSPNSFGSAITTLFRVVYTFRLSSSPPFSVSGTPDKLGFIWLNGIQIVYPYVIGGGTTNPVTLGVALQGAQIPSTTQYDSAFTLNRGSIYTICCEVKPNTSGNSDGYCKLYAKAGAFDGSDIGTLLLNANSGVVKYVNGTAQIDNFWIQPSLGDDADMGAGGYSQQFLEVLLQVPT